MEGGVDPITGMPQSAWSLERLSTNPVVLGVVLGFIAIYYLFFLAVGGTASTAAAGALSGDTEGSASWIFELIMWAAFVALVVTNGASRLANVNIVASLSSLLESTPTLDVHLTPGSSPPPKERDKDELLKLLEPRNKKPDKSGGTTTTTEVTHTTVHNDLVDVPPDTAKGPDAAKGGSGTDDEVPERGDRGDPEDSQAYHIPGNFYNYEDGEAVCAAFGGRMADVEDMLDAYEEGADWCSYGWTEGGMALFPTQLDSWRRLQEHPGLEKACGRPGLNGGYLGDKAFQIGVNCYGPKPAITEQEQELMDTEPVIPMTAREADFERRVDQWRTQLSSVQVSPFSSKEWSE